MIEVSGELARSVLDAVPDAVVVADAGGRIEFANAGAESAFGYSRAELVGRPIETLLPERYRAGGDGCGIFSVEAAGRATRHELVGLHRDGREFPAEMHLGLVRNAGEILVTGAIRDISKRVHARHALEAARDEFARANRLKSGFLAAASHSLRQPLQTLSMLNGVLSRTATPASRAEEIAERSGEALDSIAALLDSLFEVSELDAGAIEPDLRDASVAQIFERLRVRFAGEAEAKGLAFRVESCEDIVHTDPVLLERIVRNLVANAIRFTHDGLVELRCLTIGNAVRIDVLDTGVGIASDDLRLVFEEFYQVPEPAGRVRTGLGLGLSIARRVADLLRLPLHVESDPGSGSRFCVTVPRGGAGAVRAPAQKGDSGTGGAHRRVVLVIDDDRAVAKATAMLLDVLGYVPVVACDLDTAEGQVEAMREPPDLLICDFHLGHGVTGVDAILALRSLADRQIPALLVTGDSSRSVGETTVDLDTCEMLTKPIQADALADAISRWLA